MKLKQISWKKLIIFSVIIGVFVAILNRLPFLNGTSFQDPAINFDIWIVLAIFLILSCKNYKEAAAKCFVFFLISQPLIYLTEAIIDTTFYGSDFMAKIATYFNNYYIGNYWLLLTFLTIPGAIIAYQVKRDNILSGIILAVATGFLGFFGVQTLFNVCTISFPFHLISAIFCLVFAILLIFVCIKNKTARIIAITITVIAMATSLFFSITDYNTPALISTQYSLEEGAIIEKWSENEDVAKVIDDGESGFIITTSASHGTTKVHVIDDKNIEHVYLVVSSHNNLVVTEE